MLHIFQTIYNKAVRSSKKGKEGALNWTEKDFGLAMMSTIV